MLEADSKRKGEGLGVLTLELARELAWDDDFYYSALAAAFCISWNF